MLQDPPRTLPYQMPMTAAVAPAFAARYPEAAIIFDNLHSMHDVVSDILANPSVPRGRKRAEILLAARRFRDDTSYVMSVEAWRTMAVEMGAENMGGPSVNFLAALPVPTVSRGAVMQHDDATGKMTGVKSGTMAGMAHGGMTMGATAAPPPMDHAAMGHTTTSAVSSGGATVASDSSAAASVVARFHEALAAGDSAKALAMLAPDVTILESGSAETLADYRAHHLAADIAFARAVPSVRGAASVTVTGDVAWVSSTSTTKGTFQGRAINSIGAELMVLARQGGTWRIRAIHWSSRATR
jgi:ketosteroid isomerase-like protein